MQLLQYNCKLWQLLSEVEMKLNALHNEVMPRRSTEAMIELTVDTVEQRPLYPRVDSAVEQ